MARISLERLRHSYPAEPAGDADWALKEIDLELADGGAYALLGPSGCGKTTLLNIVSGLLKPTAGRVLFDDVDVTAKPPDERNIAQVFQFPVVYDTMTVYDNLAFPLRNRGVAEADVDARVREIAEHARPGADAAHQGSRSHRRRQAEDLARARPGALGRERHHARRAADRDRPHLKWRLRSKLKELHQRIGLTMVYVTHDQTEAMTFADQVVVMHEGAVVQTGDAGRALRAPAHTFVGHFIGSPGHERPALRGRDGVAPLRRPAASGPPTRGAGAAGARTEIGVRPEFVRFADDGIPVDVRPGQRRGRHQHRRDRRAGRGDPAPGRRARAGPGGDGARRASTPSTRSSTSTAGSRRRRR